MRFILILSFLFSGLYLQAQVTGPSAPFFPSDDNINSNVIPPGCECLNFVSVCNGDPVDVPFNVRIRNKWCDGATTSRVYTVNEGLLCVNEGSGECVQTTICMDNEDESGWEVCKVQGCKVFLKRIIPSAIFIGGDLVGGGFLSPGQTSQSFLCEYRHYGPLNGPQFPEIIYRCPTDASRLEWPGIDFSSDMGYCLKLEVFEGNDLVLEQNRTFVNLGHTPLASAFNQLDQDVLYRMNLRMECCDGGGEDCTLNTEKYFWFILRPTLDYTIEATDGGNGSPNISAPFEPATSRPGDILVNQGNIFIPPNLNIPVATYTLTLDEVFNGNNVDFEISLWANENCDDDDGNDTPIAGPFQRNITEGQVIFSQALGWTDSGCSCYRVNLITEDPCTGNEISENLYFQQGPDCMSGIIGGQSGENPVFRVTGQPTIESTLQLRGNPVSNKVTFDFDLPMDQIGSPTLTITDASGRVIVTQNVPAGKGTLEIPFDQQSGIYFYSVRIAGQEYNGKIVKQ